MSALTRAQSLFRELNSHWQQKLADIEDTPAFISLAELLAEERASAYWKDPRVDKTVLPEHDQNGPRVFAGVNSLKAHEVHVVMMGQDVAPSKSSQPCGIAFAGLSDSLQNMFKVLKMDNGTICPTCGHSHVDFGDGDELPQGKLDGWIAQGVMLLNVSLTVRESAPGSHKAFGWPQFTAEVLQVLNAQTQPILFVTFGGDARKVVEENITNPRHGMREFPHPSPRQWAKFATSRWGFEVNCKLCKMGKTEIDWRRRQ